MVDASVARAAGGTDAVGSSAANREFLDTLSRCQHEVVASKAIADEWRRHASSYAKLWQYSMQSRGRWVFIVESGLDELCARLHDADFLDHLPTPEEQTNVRRAMMKDAHLLLVAAQDGRRIASLDDTVRRHFGRCASSVPEVDGIYWVNPGKPDEKACAWLERDAPDEDCYRLASFST